MKIFITGGNGFLGSAVSAGLLRLGHEVIRPGSHACDLNRPESLLQFNHRAYDLIYHLAAWTQAGDFCLHHSGEQWLINQSINTNVLNWWQRYQPQARLIAIGTSCAYAPDRELIEENYLLGQPIDSLFTYAMTKRMLYIGLKSLHQQFGLRYLCLVPSTLYGPGYHTDGRQMHFIFDLIRKILRAQAGGPPAVLWGDGQQKRELVALGDFIGTMFRLVDRAENTIINIGAGVEYSIREFAETICQIIGYDSDKIQYDTSRYVGARSKVLDIRRLRQYLPDYAPKPLHDGLAETIRWFQDHWHLINQPAQAA